MLSQITPAGVIWDTSAKNLKLIYINSLSWRKTMTYVSESISLIFIHY